MIETVYMNERLNISIRSCSTREQWRGVSESIVLDGNEEKLDQYMAAVSGELVGLIQSHL